MSAQQQFDTGSFRDRSARVFHQDGSVFRAMDQVALREWKHVSPQDFFQKAMKSRKIVRTELVSTKDQLLPEPNYAAVLQHERLPLITWPFEWCFSMLRDAALLQLELMESSLSAGCIFKDASAYNFQFRGSNPVFIDVPSIVSLTPGTPWEGYRQFCQMFLYPLMLQAWKGIDFQPWLRGSLEGIRPEQFAKLLSTFDLARPGALTHVWLHSRMQSVADTKVSTAASLQTNGFTTQMIKNNVAGLSRLVQRLQWKAAESTWSDYDAVAAPVSRDASAKEQFVECVVSSKHWNTVWDLGCNLGRYSRIAAKSSDLVVAMDADHLTIDRLYQSLRKEQNEVIVPLVMDLSNPSPALGWRGKERTPLELRSKPDLVFCLALIHHLVIGSNLLLADVIEWLASLNAAIVIEFVDRDDAQVMQLLKNRSDVFSDYNREAFVRLIERRFTVEQQVVLPSGTRRLFHLQPAKP